MESTASSAGESRPELSLEELVRQTKPAVLYLKSLTKSGTGFFVTETGVIATNAHLARGEEALLATLPNASVAQTLSGFGVAPVTSFPDGAEIFLDNRFVGTTPATLRIPEGTHTLALKSAHHADWSRSISILKDSTVTVKASLDPI